MIGFMIDPLSSFATYTNVMVTLAANKQASAMPAFAANI